MFKAFTRCLLFLALLGAMTGCSRVVLKCRTLSTDSSWLPMTTDGLTVRDGQRLRYEVEAKPDVYLYVLHVGASGSGVLLYPSVKGADAANYLPAERPLALPASGWFTVAPPAGTERLMFIAARHRIAELDAVAGEPMDAARVADLQAGLAARRAPDYRVVRDFKNGEMIFKCKTDAADPELVGEVTLHHISR